jgi:hypothetical protein
MDTSIAVTVASTRTLCTSWQTGSAQSTVWSELTSKVTLFFEVRNPGAVTVMIEGAGCKDHRFGKGMRKVRIAVRRRGRMTSSPCGTSWV